MMIILTYDICICLWISHCDEWAFGNNLDRLLWSWECINYSTTYSDQISEVLDFLHRCWKIASNQQSGLHTRSSAPAVTFITTRIAILPKLSTILEFWKTTSMSSRKLTWVQTKFRVPTGQELWENFAIGTTTQSRSSACDVTGISSDGQVDGIYWYYQVVVSL